MALTPLVLTDARIYFDSLDATGYSNHVEVAAAVEDEDVTTMASGGWKQFVGGLASTTANAKVFWQAGDLSQPDDVAWANLGVSSQNPLTITPTSGAVGTLAYLTNVLESSYNPGADVGKPLAADINWMGNT